MSDTSTFLTWCNAMLIQVMLHPNLTLTLTLTVTVTVTLTLT